MRKTFTLVELLVVVAIIGILASLLMPALGNARAEAHRALCTSNLKQIGLAFTLYEENSDGLWPSEYSKTNGFPNETKAPQQMLLDMMDNRDVFICPTDKSPQNYTWHYNGFLKRDGFLPSRECSYMVNEHPAWFYVNRTGVSFRRESLNEPSKWLEMTDGGANLSGGVADWRKISLADANKRIDWWHNRSTVSGLYGDGHVKPVNALTGGSISCRPENY